MMRYLIRALLILSLLAGLAGCASAISSGYGQGGRDAGGRSYAEARADNRISAEVISGLVDDRRVPAMGIKVRTRNAVVTLSGTVPSASALRRAGEIAAAVAGVVSVDNRLRIER